MKEIKLFLVFSLANLKGYRYSVEIEIGAYR